MKEKLRKKLKDKRRKLSKEKQRKKSKKIKEKLVELKEFKNAKTILFYISYNSEVSTHEIIKNSFKNKKIVVPISNKKDYSLTLSELKSWKDLEKGAYGVLEPKMNFIKKISIDKIDLIIVPGVAFDKKGNRLGHGKGYYDRLLEKSKVKKIALAFELQIVKNIPMNENDIPVDIIITEKRMINCQN